MSCVYTVEASEVKLSGGIILESELNNISRKFETYLRERGYRMSHELISDGDSQRIQTTFKNYYYPSTVA